MSSSTVRLAVSGSRSAPASPGEPAWFAVGFVLSLVVLAGAVYRLVTSPAHEESHWLSAAAPLLMATVAVLSGVRWSIFFCLSFAARRRLKHSVPIPATHWPFVSIFVPCFNESETIEPALESLLELDYPAYEVVVVNDGSTDDTLARARRFEGGWGGCTVRVFDKPNGGKWSAHNFAFQKSQAELILCVDADSRLEPDSLRHLVARMADPRIDGVAGQMRVRNRVNLITRLQALEYLMGNGAVRMAQGFCDTVLVVPGPIGLFRRSAMEEVWHRYGEPVQSGRPGHIAGPFEGSTFAEDFDLSLAILCLGGRIVYEPAAVSHTKAPEGLFALVNQRYRWIRGSIQVLRKLWHRSRSDRQILTPRLFGWVVSTYLPDLIVLPLLYVVGLATYFALLLDGSNVLPLLAWSVAFVLLQFNAGAFFTSIHKDTLRLLAVLPIYGLYNGFVLNSAWLISVIDEFRGSRMRW